jgi:hypothetical protein
LTPCDQIPAGTFGRRRAVVAAWKATAYHIFYRAPPSARPCAGGSRHAPTNTQQANFEILLRFHKVSDFFLEIQAQDVLYKIKYK